MSAKLAASGVIRRQAVVVRRIARPRYAEFLAAAMSVATQKTRAMIVSVPSGRLAGGVKLGPD